MIGNIALYKVLYKRLNFFKISLLKRELHNFFLSELKKNQIKNLKLRFALSDIIQKNTEGLNLTLTFVLFESKSNQKYALIHKTKGLKQTAPVHNFASQNCQRPLS